MGKCRRLLIPVLALFLCSGASGSETNATLGNVTAALSKAIEASPIDLNRLASLGFPLASTPGLRDRPKVHHLLERLKSRLRTMDLESLSCHEKADFLLLGRFLTDAGFPPGRRPAACPAGSEDLFATINALLFACRFGGGDHRILVPGGLERLEAAVGLNGQIQDDNGRGGYYLTSHGVLAIHACGGERTALWKGQEALLRTPPAFLRNGFLDGLAESLVFLHWMDVPIPQEKAFLALLEQRTNPDGGLCLIDRPGCHSHWHATSLLLQLQNMSP